MHLGEGAVMGANRAALEDDPIHQPAGEAHAHPGSGLGGAVIGLGYLVVEIAVEVPDGGVEAHPGDRQHCRWVTRPATRRPAASGTGWFSQRPPPAGKPLDPSAPR